MCVAAASVLTMVSIHGLEEGIGHASTWINDTLRFSLLSSLSHTHSERGQIITNFR